MGWIAIGLRIPKKISLLSGKPGSGDIDDVANFLIQANERPYTDWEIIYKIEVGVGFGPSELDSYWIKDSETVFVTLG